MHETPAGRPGLDGVVTHAQELLRKARTGPPQWVRYDLSFGQLRLLFFLSRFGPISVGRLADRLNVSDATASEIVDRLERRGLVARSHSPEDRRRVACALSDDGVRLLAEIAGTRREALRAALSTLDDEELRQLDGLLARMLDRLPPTDGQPASTEPASTNGDDPVQPPNSNQASDRTAEGKA